MSAKVVRIGDPHEWSDFASATDHIVTPVTIQIRGKRVVFLVEVNYANGKASPKENPGVAYEGPKLEPELVAELTTLATQAVAAAGSKVNYSDVYAVVQEITYLSTFHYKKDMVKFLKAFKEWFVTNPDKKLTPEELATFDAYIAEVSATAKEHTLKAISKRFVEWIQSW